MASVFYFRMSSIYLTPNSFNCQQMTAYTESSAWDLGVLCSGVRYTCRCHKRIKSNGYCLQSLLEIPQPWLRVLQKRNHSIINLSLLQLLRAGVPLVPPTLVQIPLPSKPSVRELPLKASCIIPIHSLGLAYGPSIPRHCELVLEVNSTMLHIGEQGVASMEISTGNTKKQVAWHITTKAPDSVQVHILEMDVGRFCDGTCLGSCHIPPGYLSGCPKGYSIPFSAYLPPCIETWWRFTQSEHRLHREYTHTELVHEALALT